MDSLTALTILTVVAISLLVGSIFMRQSAEWPYVEGKSVNQKLYRRAWRTFIAGVVLACIALLALGLQAFRYMPKTTDHLDAQTPTCVSPLED